MKERLFLPWLAGGLLFALFWASRLTNLTALPIFVDEGLHLSWAQQMLVTGNFLQGTAAGKFLYIWLIALVINLANDPLVAARILSIGTGLISGIATFYLARTLWPDSNSAWLAALIYVFLPLPLICERMALVDSLLAGLATLILIFSIKLIRDASKASSYALGLCLGLAYLTKLSGFIYWVIPILAFIILKEQKSTIKPFIYSYLIAFLVASPTIFELPKQFLYEAAVRSVFNPIASQVSASDWRMYSLGETWVDLMTYVTWPILLLALTRLGYELLSKARQAILLAVLLLLTPGVYLLLAKDVWFSRYLLPIVPIIIVLAARAINDWVLIVGESTRLRSKGVWLSFVCLLAMLPSLIFDYRLITNPSEAPFTVIDRWQYVTGWPAGYGLAEVVTRLRQEAGTKGEITVITGSHPGPTQEGLRLYLDNHMSTIKLKSIHHLKFCINRLRRRLNPLCYCSTSRLTTIGMGQAHLAL
ncbi:MAG: hypothetical protein DPW09_19005 [Anaerolineae bacterium]|nr:glycosyltransferase family 39 protein [Anaerolineales bacterium]MCQ3975531.1 hypothetical protein [Anaerolineae bacterium]